MVTLALFALSFLLLPLPPEWLAVLTSEAGTAKFFVNILSHMVSHANLGHFVGNYMVFMPYALYLERRIGSKHFLLSFVLCGLAAAFLHFLAVPDTVGMIGSSGAAFGIILMATSLYGKTKIERLAAFSLTSLIMLNQLINGLFNIFSNVGFWAHFGGGSMGLLLVVFFFRHSKSKSDSK